MKRNRLHFILPILCGLLSSCSLDDGVTVLYQCLNDHEVGYTTFSETPCSSKYKDCQPTSDAVIENNGSKLYLCYRCTDPETRYNKTTKKCESISCDEELSTCLDNQVMECVEGVRVLKKQCTSSQKCDAETSDCIDIDKESTCTEGKFTCDGKTLVKCKNGLEIEVEICADDSSCNDKTGTCDKTNSVCRDQSFTCIKESLYQCQNGEQVKIDTCDNANACDEENGKCISRSDICVDGTFSCDDQTLMECIDGKFIKSKDCAKTETCDPEQALCIDNTPVQSGECSTEKEGQSCTETDEKKPCGKFICRSGQCVQEPADAGTVCRKAAGKCDITEKCDGISTECPQNQFREKGTQCRDKLYSCDEPETCTGSSAYCPKQIDTNICSCPKYNTEDSRYALTETTGVRPFKNGQSDYAGFVLKDDNTWSENTEFINALGTRVEAPALNFSHTMSIMSTQSYIGYKKGYIWDTSDINEINWEPQGITGGSREGTDLKIVAWEYTKGNDPSNADYHKRVRVSFINTSQQPPTYQHVLLAEPTSDSKKLKPVMNSAGSVIWAWPYLYETDTNNGLRVFDMSRIVEASTSDDCQTRIGMYNDQLCAYGYQYVMPQVSYYKLLKTSNCSDFRFSVAGIERRESNSILAAEYIAYSGNDKTCMYSRMLRYPLESNGKLKASNGYVEPEGGWYTGNCNLQGATTILQNGVEYFIIATTRKSGSLYISTTDGSYFKELTPTTNATSFYPQGIYITTKSNAWFSTQRSSNSERSVYYTDALKYLP